MRQRREPLLEDEQLFVLLRVVCEVEHEGFLKRPEFSRPPKSVERRPEPLLLIQHFRVELAQAFSKVLPGELQYIGLFVRLRGVALGEHPPQAGPSLFEKLDLAFDLDEERL